jgi:outer membrane protein assembly factor BamB
MRSVCAIAFITACLCSLAEIRWGNGLSPNSVSSVTGLPATCTSTNLVWEVRLGTHQYSIPTIDRGKIFLGINDQGVQREGYLPSGGGAVVCLDLKTGKTLWTLPIPRVADGTVPPNFFDQWRCGVCSGPVAVGKRVFLVGNRGDVLCLDREGQLDGNDGPFRDERRYMGLPDDVPLTPQDGDIIWRYDFRKECSVLIHDTCGSTIQFVDNLLIVCTSNGTDRHHQQPLAPDAPSLIVLDAETGALIARDREAEMGRNILHGNWSSPCFAEVSGKKLIFFAAGDGILYAFELPKRRSDGTVQQLKKVWASNCTPNHFRMDEQGKKKVYSSWQNKRQDGPSEAIGTPVYSDGHLYVATGQSPLYGLGAACLTCFDALTGAVVWRTEKLNRSLATAAIKDNILYLPDQASTLHAFDVKTGETIWTHDVGSTVCYANAFVADDKVYLGTERGGFWIFKAGREKEVLFNTRLPSPPITVTATEGALLMPLQNRIRLYRDVR